MLCRILAQRVLRLRICGWLLSVRKCQNSCVDDKALGFRCRKMPSIAYFHLPLLRLVFVLHHRVFCGICWLMFQDAWENRSVFLNRFAVVFGKVEAIRWNVQNITYRQLWKKKTPLKCRGGKKKKIRNLDVFYRSSTVVGIQLVAYELCIDFQGWASASLIMQINSNWMTEIITGILRGIFVVFLTCLPWRLVVTSFSTGHS